MTTASETTIKLIRNRLEMLSRNEDEVRGFIAERESAIRHERVRLARIVAEREALQADLDALTATEEVATHDAVGPNTIRPGVLVVCQVCGKPIEVTRFDESSYGWVHRSTPLAAVLDELEEDAEEIAPHDAVVPELIRPGAPGIVCQVCGKPVRGASFTESAHGWVHA